MRRDAKVRARVAALTPTGRVVICTITRGEVLYGLARLPEGKRRSAPAARGGLPGLALVHACGGGLTQTGQLLTGRHLFALQGPPDRLGADLLDQREVLVYSLHDLLGHGCGLGRQPLLYVRGTGHDRGGQVEAVAIGGGEPRGGRCPRGRAISIIRFIGSRAC
jgi:hypothetical protein